MVQTFDDLLNTQFIQPFINGIQLDDPDKEIVRQEIKKIIVNELLIYIKKQPFSGRII